MSEDAKKSPIPNHIIIGLGGTGGRIIRSLRRTIYEEFREKHPVAYTRDENGRITGIAEHPIKLAYLYVDSNPELMGPEDPTWKIPGGTLQLGGANQVLIGAGNLRRVIDDINTYPGIRQWIGSKTDWHAILDGQVSDTQGGQKRRLGRFLFAANSATSSQTSFNSRLQNQVSEMTANRDARCVFHVCAGLAGGTGSGTVVDVVTQIRKQYPYAGTHLVILYLMLPEANPDPRWARANYHANGYAALVELNAISAGAYKPYDISGNGQRVDFSNLGTTPIPAFDGCYVFSNHNQNDKMIGVSDYQLHEVLANFLYQKIVVADDSDWTTNTLRFFEECENGDKNTGDNHPERASDEPGAPLLRSRRFLTFGIKRLVIPEEEIREFMCYSSSRQMALQSLYNNWSDNLGFTGEPLNTNIVELVRAAEARNRWKISDEHFILSSPILKHEESWKSLDKEWEVVDQLQAAIREKEQDRRVWLSAFSVKCQEFYDKNFRGHGVERFYASKEADAKDQAREIVRLIEADLFSEWRDGKHSIHDISRKLEEIIKLLGEFRSGCDEQIVEFKRRAGDTEERSRIVHAIELNNREWFKIGPLSDLMGKRKELLDAQTQLYKKLYTAKTRACAWNYAKKLSNHVVEEVSRLKTSTANIVSRLLQVVDGDTSRQAANPFVGLDERISNRCRLDETEDLRSEVIKIYEPKRVRDFTSRLTKNRNLQLEHAESFRKAVCDKLDKRAGFFAMDTEYSLPKLFDALEAEADSKVEVCHNSLVASDSSVAPILGQNIIKGLASRFPDEMDLRSFLIKVMQESGLLLKFDNTQEIMNGSGCIAGSRQNDISVLLPASARGETEFYSKLVGYLKEANSGIKIVRGSRPNALTILSLANLFPLRYVEHCGFLKSKFEQRVSSGDPARDARARLELFTEGDGTQFPDLFALSGSQLRELALPLVLLLKAPGLEIIRRLTHHVTGDDLGWNFYDELKPQEPPLPLGKTDRDILENCDGRLVTKMQLRLRERLGSGDSALKLKQSLDSHLQQFTSEVVRDFPNPADPQRQQLLQAVEQAKILLTQSIS
jgi:hypothetical protein